MSQITRCPSCATLFKVVQDQLRISDGWVRCGQCQEVFDATLSLQEAPAVVPPQTPDAQAQTTVAVAGAIALPATIAAQPDGVVPAGMPKDGEAHGGGQRPAQVNPAEEQEETTPELPAAQSEPEQELKPHAALVLNPPSPLLPQPEPEGYELPAALNGADVDAEASPDTDADGDGDARRMTDAASAEFPLHPPFMAELKKNTGSLGAETVKAEQPFTPGFRAESLEQERAAARPEGGSDPGGGNADDADHAMVDSEAVLPRLLTDAAKEQAQGLQDASEAAASAFAAQRLSETPPEKLPETLPQEPAQPLSAAAQDDEPSFVRSAKRQALWNRPAVRLGLGAAVLLLAASLLLQVALQQRHYLASARPQWRPVLQALCVPLQCKVQAYQHIASVVVDGSAFNKLRGNSYRFALTLKNQSAVPVALPAVELTLTDTSDQPVLRRVLTPAELAAPATLPAGGEWSTSLDMDVLLAGNDAAQIAGYRVLAFYP